MLIGPQNMPNFPDTTLRPEDKRAIIAYIEALRETARTPAASTPVGSARSPRASCCGPSGSAP